MDSAWLAMAWSFLPQKGQKGLAASWIWVSGISRDGGTELAGGVFSRRSRAVLVPEADGAITFKLWSATRGIVEMREGVAGGEAVEFAIPDWNCWHWVGGWREAAGELVLSLWLRHELEE